MRQVSTAKALVYAPSTQGDLRAQLQTPSFRITEASYGARTKFPPHAHEYPSITAVFSGGFSERFRKESHSCTSQSVLLKPAAEIHSNTYGDAPTRCLLVAVTEPRGSLHRIFTRTIHHRGGVAYSLLLALKEELQAGDDVAPLAAEGLLLEFLARVERDGRQFNRSLPPWLSRLHDELRSRCREPLGMTHIAEITGVHPVYAARLFRHHYGCAPIEFVRRCRIDWATTTLLETSLSISEISIAAGFSDQSHFTRVFTKHTGRTPGAVRSLAWR